jgi:hypothetical protein
LAVPGRAGGVQQCFGTIYLAWQHSQNSRRSVAEIELDWMHAVHMNVPHGMMLLTHYNECHAIGCLEIAFGFTSDKAQWWHILVL